MTYSSDCKLLSSGTVRVAPSALMVSAALVVLADLPVPAVRGVPEFRCIAAGFTCSTLQPAVANVKALRRRLAVGRFEALLQQAALLIRELA